MIKNKKYILFLTIFIFTFVFTSCNKNTQNNNINRNEIYTIVKEAFLTQSGYSDKISKHMSESVFNKINSYKVYSLNDKKHKKPIKINLDLKQKSQETKSSIIYENMIYSITIKDSQNKTISSSWNVPIKFTIQTSNDTWYITNKEELA
ncbi:hypothetical protein [Clostridium tyrobutyricum]|mgnify:FL=1|uniref:hypothetical protein n=1 Tax=Clostridium tyrobutyricum TaxID=1519 RepID=UPI001FAD4278|nr:hypothetical protein [Clostridium tyrobutyricum]